MTRGKAVVYLAGAALAGLLTLAKSTPQTPPRPTFSHDIAPLLYENCVACHYPGGPGPFSLLTYADAAAHAREVAAATQSKFMPPFPPEAGYGSFQDEHRLTKEQIACVAAWASHGAPEGSPAEAPQPPNFPLSQDWQLGTPDLILRASQPLTVPPDGPDVFWNFVFRPPISSRRYVRAVEIKPGNARIAHHANLLIERTGAISRREKQPGGGFPGMELNIGRNPLDPESHFLFWKPGSRAYSEAPGFSWILDPGNVLVLNAHLQPSGKQEQIAPSIGIYFTNEPPTRFPILIQLQHDDKLNIPPGARDFEVSDDLQLPSDVDVLAVYPHAHYLGSLLEAYATLPGGKREWLIKIPHWDLNWQAIYRYKQPLFLPKGTTVSMRFHYDNSPANPRNPNHPPKFVRAGNRARDEMGHLWLQLLPRGEGDHRRPLHEAVLRHRLAINPRDPTSHLNLGAVLLSRLDAQGAAAEFRTAIQLDDRRAEAHDMLGAALQNTGRLQEATEQFEAALKIDPEFMNAHYNLALALTKAGRWKEALPHLRTVAAAYPDNERIQTQYRDLELRAAESKGSQ